MLTRVKTFVATGVAPNGRLYAGDLNAIQDAVAAQSDFAQTVGVGTLQIGETGLALNRYAAGEARISGALRTDGVIRGASFIAAAATTGVTAFQSLVSGEAFARYYVSANGSTRWGDGTIAAETYFVRAGSRYMQMNATLQLIVASGALSYLTSIDGDTWPRFQILGTGSMAWGAGAGSTDTTLYRNAAGELRTDGSLRVGANTVLTANGIQGPSNMDFRSTTDVFVTTDTTTNSVSLRDLSGNYIRLRNRIVEINSATGVSTITFNADVNLYRGAADVLQTDDRLVLSGAQVAGQSWGLQVGPTGSLVMHYQGYIAGSAVGYIGHNSWFGSDGLFHWDGTHASFGSRGILFNYSGASNGITFYADVVATTAGSTFNPAPRMIVRNDGDIQVVNKLLLGATGDATLYRSAANTVKTDGNIDIAGNLTVTGAISGGGVVPSGAMMEYGGAAAPTGWLLADGTAVSRTTYAALFAAIGTAYGVGDNSTTFNLPNMKGRMPIGLDAANPKFDVRGETGGAETVALSVAELATHAHTITDPTHTHTMNNPTHPHGTNGTALGGINPNAPGQAGVLGSNETSLSIPVSLGVTAASANQTAVANSSGITINNNGSGTAHQNLPPYIAVNYIIKT